MTSHILRKIKEVGKGLLFVVVFMGGQGGLSASSRRRRGKEVKRKRLNRDAQRKMEVKNKRLPLYYLFSCCFYHTATIPPSDVHGQMSRNRHSLMVRRGKGEKGREGKEREVARRRHAQKESKSKSTWVRSQK